MTISIDLLILVVWPVATALVGGLLFVDDRIIRDVCRREGRPYSISWLFSWYWQGRISKLSWFGQAKEAGYFGDRVVLLAALIGLVIIVIAMAAGGFVARSVPLVHR
jgi:hypothetical protein